MFFVFDNVPDLPRLDFRGNTNIKPEAFAQLQKLLAERIELQKFAANSTKPQTTEIEKLSDKLGFSIDLLELCEKEQIVPEGAVYKGFLKNQNKALRLFYNPDVIFSTDLIYARYVFSLATTRSAKDEMDNIRKVIHQLDIYNDTIKSIIDKTRLANVRIFRLHHFQNLVFSALGANSRLFELNHRTVEYLDYLLRINFASILIIKALATPLAPEKATFLSQLCKKSWMICRDSKAFWEETKSPELQVLVDFFDLATSFFFFLTMYAVIRCNIYENDGLLKKNKDYKTITWENYILSEEIRKLLKIVSQQKFKSNDLFNIDENRRVFTSFYDVFMGSLTEECIKSYTYLKDDMGAVNMKQPGAIVNSVGITGDFIEKVLRGDS